MNYFDIVLNVVKNIPGIAIVIMLGVLLLHALLRKRSRRNRDDRRRIEIGKAGEGKVNTLLRQFLGTEYRLIPDVTLPSGKGTAQIDHIVVSPYGIFVIETKNWAGLILGNEIQEQWMRIHRDEKNWFYNPIKQNQKHVQVLQSFLKLDANKFVSVIAFVGNAQFRDDMPENVTVESTLIPFIRHHNRILLSDWQVENVVTRIESERLARSTATDKRHIRYAQAAKRRRAR